MVITNIGTSDWHYTELNKSYIRLSKVDEMKCNVQRYIVLHSLQSFLRHNVMRIM